MINFFINDNNNDINYIHDIQKLSIANITITAIDRSSSTNVESNNNNISYII